MSGGYDHIQQPNVIAEDWDYICFSNDISESKIGVWQIRPIPFHHRNHKRIAMFAKFHPHTLLPEYDYAVWLDANNTIKDHYIYQRADDFYNHGDIVAHIMHPECDCIYKEAFRCLYYNKDGMLNVIKTLRFLVKNNYPHRQGLYENNLIYWNHHAPLIVDALEDFWRIYIKVSKRDQLTLNYVYFKLNISPSLYLPVGEHMQNSQHIGRRNHTEKDKSSRITRKDYWFNRCKMWIVRFIFLLSGEDMRNKILYK